jgi:hypothetical protein
MHWILNNHSSGIKVTTVVSLLVLNTHFVHGGILSPSPIVPSCTNDTEGNLYGDSKSNKTKLHPVNPLNKSNKLVETILLDRRCYQANFSMTAKSVWAAVIIQWPQHNVTFSSSIKKTVVIRFWQGPLKENCSFRFKRTKKKMRSISYRINSYKQ